MDANVASETFSITSPVFDNNGPIPPLYTCKGQNSRPPLSLLRPPETTKSLAIILRDPDAVNGDWTHWVIWNIEPKVATIDEQTLPDGAVEGQTSFGKSGYGGPCPPKGTGAHRYVFEAYALDTLLDLPKDTKREQLQAAMQGHILGQARLTGSFSAD